jgi:hypothetical protein
MIGKAKNRESLRLDYGRAGGVCFLSLLGKMLSTVQFDYELGCVTDEVCDVAFNGDLTAETCAIQAMVAEFRPKDSFGIRGIPS